MNIWDTERCPALTPVYSVRCLLSRCLFLRLLLRALPPFLLSSSSLRATNLRQQSGPSVYGCVHFIILWQAWRKVSLNYVLQQLSAFKIYPLLLITCLLPFSFELGSNLQRVWIVSTAYSPCTFPQIPYFSPTTVFKPSLIRDWK